MGARTLFTSVTPVHHNIIKTLSSKWMGERLKLPGASEKETWNMQLTYLGVYKRRRVRAWRGGGEEGLIYLLKAA